MRYISFDALIMVTFLIFMPVRAQNVQLTIQATPLGQSACSGQFIEHPLDHTTLANGPRVRFYDSDGAGLAINDLNNDGLLDVVLANLKGRSTILWNEGDLHFRKGQLADGQARAVNIVDVDGDGWQDIVITHSLSAPTYWHNTGSTGNVRFEFGTLPGVRKPSYSMTWGDVNGDGSLDVMTGSYDSDLGLQLRDTFLFSEGAGIYYFEQHQGEFTDTRLAKEAQALAILLTDFNSDGAPDLIVGNDFVTRDQIWTYQQGSWQEIHPFAVTARNSMSLDIADIHNNGRWELFEADMKPYSSDPKVLDDWKPVFDAFLSHGLASGDPQINENVLQVPDQEGIFTNSSEAMGADATGWSWSAKFGDLNQDGYLDLYIVNGMIAADLFNKLPGDELVEENQVLRNEGGERFVRENGWGLNSTASGRGMSMADLDNDGDLDIVVNNLNTPAMVYENQLCMGNSLEVDLRWASSKNTHALGAELTLTTSTGSYSREVKAASGYLSGDPSRIHFGFPNDSQLIELMIRWPDGETTRLSPVESNTLLVVTRL